MKVVILGSLLNQVYSEELQASVSNFTELLVLLEKEYGRDLIAKIMEKGAVKDTMIILLNGRRLPSSRVFSTTLREEDQVTIFPMTAGG